MYDSGLTDQYIDVLDDVKSEFQSGQKHQSWKLVPARDIKLLWAKFSKYGRVDEELMEKIWSILRVTVLKILINSDIKDGNLADSFFEKDDYKEITEEEWERWFMFISDRSGSNRIRNTGEMGTGGNGRYSDRDKTLYKYADEADKETNSEQKIIKIDRLLNFIHGLGSMAHWFVEGGESTLDSIRDYSAKGIVNTGTISESFLDAFENPIRGESVYVEVFINPTQREISEVTSHDEYGIIISGKNAYVWNRDLAYHFQVRKFLGNKVDSNYVCGRIVIEGNNKVSLIVSDDTIKSNLHHNPEIGNFIQTHPFFKDKTLMDVLYYDQHVVGDWQNLKG